MRDVKRGADISGVTRIIRAESEAISNTPEHHDFARAVDLIYKRVHCQKGKVITSRIR